MNCRFEMFNPFSAVQILVFAAPWREIKLIWPPKRQAQIQSDVDGAGHGATVGPRPIRAVSYYCFDRIWFSLSLRVTVRAIRRSGLEKSNLVAVVHLCSVFQSKKSNFFAVHLSSASFLPIFVLLYFSFNFFSNYMYILVFCFSSRDLDLLFLFSFQNNSLHNFDKYMYIYLLYTNIQ